MKSIIVKNLAMQFDSFDDGADRHTIHNMMEAINEVIRKSFPNEQPVFLVSVIDDSDFEIADESEYEEVELPDILETRKL
jgi:hypothetical protein